MSRVLLDENIPVALRTLLGDHEVFSVGFLGWSGISNGRLLDTAEAASFDILISADQNLQFQQNISGRRLALIMLSTTTNWNAISKARVEIVLAVNRAKLWAVELVAVAPGDGRL